MQKAAIFGLSQNDAQLLVQVLERKTWQAELLPQPKDHDALVASAADAIFIEVTTKSQICLDKFAQLFPFCQIIICGSSDKAYASQRLKLPLTESAISACLAEAANSPILDLRVIRSIEALAGDEDPEFTGSLMRIFLGRGPDLIADMKTALGSQDPRRLEHSAHSLKGSCGNLGAKYLMGLCEALEAQGRDHNLVDSLALWERIHYGFYQVKRILEDGWLLHKAS